MSVKDWYLRKFGWVPRPVRQIIIIVIGGTFLLLGLLGMALPIMPGWIFLPLALAILALEFAWAARWLIKIRKATRHAQQSVSDGFRGGERGPWPARMVWRLRKPFARIGSRFRRRSAPPIASPPAENATDSPDFEQRAHET
jgi:hypothetical protein